MSEGRTDPPVIGSRVGDFQLERLLRAGRCSRTFRATHLNFDIPVAVKFLAVDEVDDAQPLRSSIRREATALARLSHPNVVRVWDVQTEGSFPYLVTEFVEGFSLEELIGRVGSLHPLLAVGLARQAVEGLAHAKERGIIHRDVKPANMIIDRFGVVKLLDFGLALIACDGAVSLPDDFDSTAPLSGTAAYLAPEQALSPATVDHRADMYSLGVTLFQAVTGALPYEATSVLGMVTKHIREPAPSADEVNPDLPRPISEVIRRMMNKEPGERFAGYDGLRVALSQAVGDRRIPRSQAETIMSFTPQAEEV